MKRFLISYATLVGACSSDETGPATVPIAAITTDVVYVVNGGESSISVLDASTNEIVGTIVLENVEYPHHIYLSGDRNKLLVAVPGSDLSGGHGGHSSGVRGAVLVLDAETGRLVKSRRLDAPNHNAAAAPDGRVWTTQMTRYPGKVLVLDPTTLATTVSADVEGMPSEVTFSTSGEHAFVANTNSDSISIFETATGALVKTVEVGDAPVGAWPAADGRMYVDNEAGRSVSVIDTTTLEVVATFDLGFTPALAALAPNGELWVTDTGGGKVIFMSTTDGAKLGELVTGAGAHAIAFNGDGSRAFITNQNAHTVSVIDVAARTVITTVAVGSKPNGMLFRAR